MTKQAEDDRQDGCEYGESHGLKQEEQERRRIRKKQKNGDDDFDGGVVVGVLYRETEGNFSLSLSMMNKWWNNRRERGK